MEHITQRMGQTLDEGDKREFWFSKPSPGYQLQCLEIFINKQTGHALGRDLLTHAFKYAQKEPGTDGRLSSGFFGGNIPILANQLRMINSGNVG
jgi:hypothetical protein